jgi:hypothetical protein
MYRPAFWMDGPRAGLDDLENILDPIGTRLPTHRSSSSKPVAIPTELSRLLILKNYSLNIRLILQNVDHRLRYNFQFVSRIEKTNSSFKLQGQIIHLRRRL